MIPDCYRLAFDLLQYHIGEIIKEGRRQEAEGRRQNSLLGFRPKSEFGPLNILLSRGLRPLLPLVARDGSGNP